MFDGYTVFPPLINAHDHLELNHYPRTKFRDRYDNAHQWGADVNARLNTSPFLELRSYPLNDRLFIGGLKNLLCGALIVAHHNPPHKYLFSDRYPVNVVRNYLWAHSIQCEQKTLYWDGPRIRSWNLNVPEIIHLAEGTDQIAHSEYRCLLLKTDAIYRDYDNQIQEDYSRIEDVVIVHGVGITDQIREHAASHLRGLVWCPSTNHYLLGETADVLSWIQAGGRLAIGSDSRLTADGDLLDEIRFARTLYSAEQWLLIEAVFDPAGILGISQPDSIEGDFFVARQFPERRSDIALIVRNHVPQIGDPELMAAYPQVSTVPASLDGVPKTLNLKLARQIAACSLKEPGLEIDELPRSRRAWFPKTR